MSIYHEIRLYESHQLSFDESYFGTQDHEAEVVAVTIAKHQSGLSTVTCAASMNGYGRSLRECSQRRISAVLNTTGCAPDAESAGQNATQRS